MAAHVLDTIGCGAGGFSSETAQRVRTLLGAGDDVLRSSAYGCSDVTSAELAALANGTSNRFLDFNDFGPLRGPSKRRHCFTTGGC